MTDFAKLITPGADTFVDTILQLLHALFIVGLSLKGKTALQTNISTVQKNANCKRRVGQQKS